MLTGNSINPANSYLIKVINRNSRKKCEICSLVFLLLTWNMIGISKCRQETFQIFATHQKYVSINLFQFTISDSLKKKKSEFGNKTSRKTKTNHIEDYLYHSFAISVILILYFLPLYF